MNCNEDLVPVEIKYQGRGLGLFKYKNAYGEIVEKHCTKCKRLFPSERFYLTARGDRKSSCVDCVKSSFSQWGEDNKGKLAEARSSRLSRFRGRTEEELREVRAEMYPDGFKNCPSCEDLMPLSSYYTDSYTLDGLASQCTPCARTRGSKYAANNTGITKKRNKRNYVKLTLRTQDQLALDTIRVHPVGNKYCKYCGDTKPVAEFYPCASSYDSLQRVCKVCSNTRPTKEQVIFWKNKGIPSDICYICGGYAEHMEHVRPRSRSKDNSRSNILPSCMACNYEKTDSDLIVYLESRDDISTVDVLEKLDKWGISYLM